MNSQVKFYEREFKSNEAKKAYLKACKWIALKIMNNSLSQDVTWKISQVNSDTPTFLLELYCGLDFDKVEKDFCKKCKELHSLFYINNNYNCSECNFITFKARINEKLKIKRDYKIEKLNYLLNRPKLE